MRQANQPNVRRLASAIFDAHHHNARDEEEPLAWVARSETRMEHSRAFPRNFQLPSRVSPLTAVFLLGDRSNACSEASMVIAAGSGSSLVGKSLLGATPTTIDSSAVCRTNGRSLIIRILL